MEQQQVISNGSSPTTNQSTLVTEHQLFFKAIALLKEQYAVGTVEIKVVRPAKRISSR
jgi:hypothetical protein